MSIRPLKANDRERLLQIWNSAAEFDFLTAELLDEKIWTDQDYDPGLAFVAETGGIVIGFGVGVVRESANRPTGYIKMLAVDTTQQGRGVGGLLLEAIETVLRARDVSTVRLLESAPNYLTPGIDVRYLRALRFVEKRGYERVGETFNLEVDLDNELPGAASVQSPDDDTIVRRAVPGDSDAILTVLQQFWPAWAEEAGVSLTNSPPSLFLAAHGATIVGFAAYDANNKGTGWFGPMGVVPEERGSGLGCILLQCCLADLREQGRAGAIIPWVGPVSFYEKCVGARLSRSFVRFEKRF